ncbi:hypothetical protein FSP39_011950 [Pinctada imbricata]|uniref:Uncharacterized protein n=1 Tax=Pinctada imbricata TaxID=66713 RepID=A0AA88Y080_PINIB|nr:hypothetical protein FSP39_011950 [Pinctada imbricata]
MWKKILALVFGVIVGLWLIDDFNPDVLKGKNVVITGASAGIGEQMAYHYARMGANVLVTARRQNILKKVVERCREEGGKDGKYFYIAADMANLSSTVTVINVSTTTYMVNLSSTVTVINVSTPTYMANLSSTVTVINVSTPTYMANLSSTVTVINVSTPTYMANLSSTVPVINVSTPTCMVNLSSTVNVINVSTPTYIANPSSTVTVINISTPTYMANLSFTVTVINVSTPTYMANLSSTVTVINVSTPTYIANPSSTVTVINISTPTYMANLSFTVTVINVSTPTDMVNLPSTVTVINISTPTYMANLSFTVTVINEAISKLGSIDYLVLNHIIPIPLGLWEGTSQNLSLANTIIDVNFKAYVHLASHALPHLKHTHGSIIVVSSLAGKIGQPFTAIYSSTKFALDGFFGGLRQELILKKCDISITLCVLGLIGMHFFIPP